MIEKVQELIKSAMKAKDALTLTTYRAVLLALSAKDEHGNVPVEAKQIPILRKMVTARKEVALTYHTNGRDDLAKVELAEAVLIEQLLPKELTEEEAIAFISKEIAKSGRTLDKKSMGLIVSDIGAAAGGVIPGKLIAREVLAAINAQ